MCCYIHILELYDYQEREKAPLVVSIILDGTVLRLVSVSSEAAEWSRDFMV